MSEDSLYERVLELRDLLVTACELRTEPVHNRLYRELRAELLAEPVAPHLPKFVKRHHTLDDFKGYIRGINQHWEPRRQHVRDAFSDALSYVEDAEASPADEVVDAALVGSDMDAVRAVWRKAVTRRGSDPEGAITAARTLLETVCKTILDERGIAYPASSDLPALYHLTSGVLKLAPSDQTEPIFKQVLGGAKSVVEGLGAVRNKLGDSHGTGRLAARPKPRHSALAVTLAGGVAAFLVETHRERREGGK